MRIGIIAVDSNYPNLALMKISTYHKQRGDSVEFYNSLEQYDIVYMSKIFSFTPDYMQTLFNAKNVIKGGSGYDINIKLPEEIDKCQPDYSLYNLKSNIAYGFLTRGCPRNCRWCIVPKKEGAIRPYNDITEIATKGKTDIILMDNNILAAGDYAKEQLRKIIDLKLKVDFNQGLDARLVDNEFAELLASVKWIKYIRFACDTRKQIQECEKAIKLLRKHGYKKEIFLYCILTEDITECNGRLEYWAFVNEERGEKIRPFAQPYRPIGNAKYDPPQWQKDMARWCNRAELFKTTSFFEYQPRKNFVCEEYFKNNQIKS